MHIQLDEEKVLQSFLELLKIPSHSQQEARVATFIIEWCKSQNIKVLEDNTQEITGSNSGNLVCTIKGTHPNIPPIFFTAHMDTIETGHVSPYVEDGYVQTDGTTALGADDKAGIVALLEGIEYVIHSNKPYGDIQLIFTVCEEQGLVGARALDKKAIKGTFGYTLDADEPVGTCITRSPALDIVTITVMRDSEEEGNDVHEAISEIIRKIAKSPVKEGFYVSIIGFKENKKVKNGGIDLTIELTSMCEEHLKHYVETLKEFTRQSIHTHHIKWEIDVENIGNSYQYKQQDPVLVLATHAANSLGLPLTYKERLDVSDANILTSEHMSTMTLGVGYEYIHTKKERMSISQLYDLTRFVIGIALGRNAV